MRRAIKDVEKYGGGEEALVAESKARKFHVIKTGKQYLVMCHPGKQKIIC
ncbi:MAG: hypothetical protein ABSF35_23130 [Polyangia bacterium]